MINPSLFLCLQKFLSTCGIKMVLYYLKILSFAFSHLCIHNLEFLFVCSMIPFYFCNGKGGGLVGITAPVVSRVTASDVPTYTWFYVWAPKRAKYVPGGRWAEFAFQHRSYQWWDRLPVVASRVLQWGKSWLASWVLCLQAECRWWSLRGAQSWAPVFSLFKSRWTLWASVGPFLI